MGGRRLGRPSLEIGRVKAPVEEQIGRMNESRLLCTGLGGQKIREPGTRGTYRPRVVTKGKSCRVRLPASNPSLTTYSVTWRSCLPSPRLWFLMYKMGKIVVIIITVSTSLGCHDD